MTSIRSQEYNGVLAYNCTAGKSTPEWAQEALKSGKSLRYDEDFRHRVELIQDFQFPEASQRIKMSKDGEFIGATGTYKPQFKCFSTHDLSLKFERHLDCETVQFQFLGSDYGKVAFLRQDRTVELHTQAGRHHSFRIPSFGRDMAYLRGNCDLYLCGGTEDVYRFNLDRGSFLAPLQTGSSEGVNVMDVNPVHQLVGMGCSNGTVECWDPRDRQRAAILDVGQSLTGEFRKLGARFRRLNPQLSALSFHSDAYSLALGTSEGHVLLYDLRAALPLWVKDHRSDLSVHTVRFHESTQKVVSSDAGSIKIWDKSDGTVFTSITPNGPINDLHVIDGSGLMLTAGEEIRCQVYYVPRLGHAPKWCSFLDNLTEELEERRDTSIYDDYQFVTRKELEELGLTHLIGTKLLKAYMHGFWMDLRLYHKVKQVAAPTNYEDLLQQQVKSAIAKRREANRIIIKRNMPAVNRELAEQLLQAPGAKRKLREAAGGVKKAGTGDKEGRVSEVLQNPFMDSRFASIFTDEDFQIDKGSADYRRLNPTAGRKQQQVAAASEDEDEEDGAADELAAELDLGDDFDEDEDMSEEEDEDAESYREGSAAAQLMRQFRPVEQGSARKKRRLGPLGSGGEDDNRRTPQMFELLEGHDRAQALSGLTQGGAKQPTAAPKMELSKRLELHQQALAEAQQQRKRREFEQRRSLAAARGKEDDELYDYTNPGAGPRPTLGDIVGDEPRRANKKGSKASKGGKTGKGSKQAGGGAKRRR